MSEHFIKVWSFVFNDALWQDGFNTVEGYQPATNAAFAASAYMMKPVLLTMEASLSVDGAEFPHECPVR